MKKIISNSIIILVLGFGVASCTKPVNELDAVRAALERYADYTYDNYMVDSLERFILETGEIKTYQVTSSSLYTTIIEHEIDEEEIGKVENEKIHSMFISIKLFNWLQPYENKDIVLNGSYPNNNITEITWVFGVESNPKPAIKDANPSFSIGNDEIYLENEDGQWMLLKKGVGIARMGDSTGHIWTSTREK